jgi:hypothetical protein
MDGIDSAAMAAACSYSDCPVAGAPYRKAQLRPSSAAPVLSDSDDKPLRHRTKERDRLTERFIALSDGLGDEFLQGSVPTNYVRKSFQSYSNVGSVSWDRTTDFPV